MSWSWWLRASLLAGAWRTPGGKTPAAQENAHRPKPDTHGCSVHAIRGKLEEEGDTDQERDDALATSYAASVQGRIAFGPAAGWQVVRIVDGPRSADLSRPARHRS